jgi:hypothetical protein
MDRAALKKQLRKRTQEAAERTDSGRRFKDIFVDDWPEGLARWKVYSPS